jgi:hypothetical protein
MKLYPTIRTDWLTANGIAFTGLPYDDDLVRDPSKYFMVYETGDNTTVAEGEATPLDLYYSRATIYGDAYEVMDYTTPDDDLLLDRWPWLENKADILSGEAGMLANPGGTFMYAVWNQWQEEITVDEFGVEHELIFDSDILFRRLMYLMDDDTTELMPLASILYVSDDVVAHSKGGELVMMGTGQEIDKVGEGEGIAEVLWSSDLQGALGNEKIIKIPVTSLSLGTHTIVFKIKDNDGVWSVDQTVKVVVLENLYQIHLPTIVR